LVHGRALRDVSVHVRDADEDAEASRRVALDVFDLVEVARLLVVDGRPEHVAHVADARAGLRVLQAFKLARDLGGEVRFEAGRRDGLARDAVQVWRVLSLVH
jgi:uncharacterized protein (DUF2252 family)